jgi:ketosteroid isomerase-like protein
LSCAGLATDGRSRERDAHCGDDQAVLMWQMQRANELAVRAKENRGMTAAQTVIDRWHQLVAARSLESLDELLADDVVFQSPAVHAPQAGKAITKKYLAAALRVLNNDTFHYVGEWHGADSAILEFETTLDGVHVNGIDMISWDATGRIVRFKVMLRPIKALHTVMALMAKELQGGG